MNLSLRQQEISFFHNNGYLILKGLFHQSEITRMHGAAQKILQNVESKTSDKTSKNYHDRNYYNIHDVLKHTDDFDHLIDSNRFFDVITHLMGPFIQMMSLHLFVRHSNCDSKKSNIMRFHTDSGPALQHIYPDLRSLSLQLKIQVFLTNVEEENHGNFICIPGSHLRKVKNYSKYCLIDECNQYVDSDRMPPDSLQLKVKAGDAIIHSLNLWHTVSPNLSGNTRLSVSLRYGQLWFRTFYHYLDESVMKRLSPRQRRLLCDFGDEIHDDIFYRPPDDQVEMMLGERAGLLGWK